MVAQDADEAGRDGEGLGGALRSVLKAVALVAGAGVGPGGGGSWRGGVDDQRAPSAGGQTAAVLTQGGGFPDGQELDEAVLRWLIVVGGRLER